MINLGALRAFYYTEKLRGVKKAARRLKVTQPAISHRLASLERRLGKKLMGRAGHYLVLTPDGRKLFERCRQAFEILESAEAELSGMETALFGNIRIAAMSEWAKVFLLPRIEAFAKKHPAVEFDLQYRPQFETLTALSRHDVDLAFSNEPYHRPQVKMTVVGEERIVCIGPKPSRRLAWDDLPSLRWIGYGAEDPVGFEFEQLAAKHGAELPKPSLQVSEVESVMRLAASGVGYALAPEHALSLRSLKGLAIHHLPCGPIIKKVYLFHLKTVPLGGAIASFWKFIAE